MDYMQIDRTNCMEIILQEFPAFQTQWDLHLASWSSADRPIALDVAEFSDFAVNTIAAGVDPEIDRLAAIIERMLLQGDSVINYAIRTMFLEQIAHRCQRRGLDLSVFTRKLQPLSHDRWQAIALQRSLHSSGMAID